MKTIILLLFLQALDLSVQSRRGGKRQSFEGYSIDLGDLRLAQSDWRGSHGIDEFLPFPSSGPSAPGKYNLKVELPPPSPSLSYLTNSLEKPVMEAQEYVPPQSIGTAVIPQVPPPATPVNAVASNVPGNNGAVFLGSGSIGVVDLGNGAYALGSGSIGYSDNRAQPRPTGFVPVYPPLPASPNLIPAAVPSPTPLPSFAQGVDFGQRLYNQPEVPQYDQNGYEYLPPNRVGFGAPNPRPLRLKTRMQYATPTALQLQPQVPQLPQVPQFVDQSGFGVDFGFNGHPNFN